MSDYQIQTREFAKMLCIAKGLTNYDQLSDEQKQNKEREIMDIYGNFLDQAFDSSPDESLKASWVEYKSSGFDSDIFTSSKSLQSAINHLTKTFLEL
jgi:hypothetical protein